MLNTSGALTTRLQGAADGGLDVNYLVWIDWPEPVGRRHYSMRPVTIGGIAYQPILKEAPRIAKVSDQSSLSSDALSDSVELRFRNVYEDVEGAPDAARIGDLMDEVSIYGALVKVGFVDMRTANGGPESEIKWDHLYRAERPARGATELTLTCTDALLLPGERPVGRPVTDGDWPKAPHASYGQVRGPVFGKVDGLPLIPLEVGFEATLDSEIDEQDTIIDLVNGDFKNWDFSGYAEIGDEIIYYAGMDPAIGRLAGVRRGTGFPRTAAVPHGGGKVVREVYSGREGLLGATIAATATEIPVTGWEKFPSSGVVMLGNEAIRYSGISGGKLVRLQRGEPVPTFARSHDAGAVLRTIPVGPDGQPRYRYLVAQGAATVVGARSVDEEGRDALKMPVPAVSQELRGGVAWTVADFTERPRVERFAASASQVPPEWVAEMVNDDPARGFVRWHPGPECTPGMAEQIGKALDPAQSTQAIIMRGFAGYNEVLDMAFNAHFDGGLNAPRRKWGRFRDARILMKVQYSKTSPSRAEFYLKKDGVTQKSGRIEPPQDTQGVHGRLKVQGGLNGQLAVSAANFQIDRETKQLRFETITEGPWTNGSLFHWVPGYTYPDGAPQNSMPSFITGTDYLDYSAGMFISDNDYAWSHRSLVGADAPVHATELKLRTSDLKHGTNRSRVTRVVLRAQVVPASRLAHWPAIPTGSVQAELRIRTGAGLTGGHITSQKITLDGNASGQVEKPLSLSGPDGVPLELQHLGSMEVVLSTERVLWTNPVTGTRAYVPVLGAIRCIWLEVETEPAIDARYRDSSTYGDYFGDDENRPQNPSDAYEQRISIGALVKKWAKTIGRDPWEFFTSPGLNNLSAVASDRGGFQLVVLFPSTGDQDLKLAIADVTLELEYEAPETYRDGELVADVNGRTGVPVGGGPAVVLENPVDLLAYLVDQSEFMGMAAQRDAASFTLAKTQMGGWGVRLARAITEEIPVRQLISELCAESRLLMLFDQGAIQARYRQVTFSVGNAVAHLGDFSSDQALRLLGKGDVIREGRVEEYANEVTLNYRENIGTGDPRASLTFAEGRGQRGPLGVRRQTRPLRWWQSSRGYSAGLAAQKQALSGLGAFLINMASTHWEYSRVRVYAAIGERLQRGDIVTVTRQQSGLYLTPARVVGTERASARGEWDVFLQFAPTSASVYWTALDGLGQEMETRIRFAAGGSRLDFYWQGTRVASLTAAGDLLVAGDLTQTKVYTPSTTLPGSTAAAPVHSNIGHGSFDLWFGRKLFAPGIYQGRYEIALNWDDSQGRIEVGPWRNNATGVVTARTVANGQNLGDILGVPNGIYDTGAGTTNGVLRFVVGGRSVLEVDDTRMRLRGGVRLNASL